MIKDQNNNLLNDYPKHSHRNMSNFIYILKIVYEFLILPD
jgi:hypothetical protein